MLTYAKAILALLQLAKMLVSLGERNMWIEDGERRAMNRELLAINKAMRIKSKIDKQVDGETDQQVLDGLEEDGDLRDDEPTESIKAGAQLLRDRYTKRLPQ